jgi:hypothetical protein
MPPRLDEQRDARRLRSARQSEPAARSRVSSATGRIERARERCVVREQCYAGLVLLELREHRAQRGGSASASAAPAIASVRSRKSAR